MNDPVFFKELAGILRVAPEKITPSFALADGEWDSVAVLSVIALIDDHFGITVSGNALGCCQTVGEVLRLAESG